MSIVIHFLVALVPRAHGEGDMPGVILRTIGTAAAIAATVVVELCICAIGVHAMNHSCSYILEGVDPLHLSGWCGVAGYALLVNCPQSCDGEQGSHVTTMSCAAHHAGTMLQPHPVCAR